ncbi:BTAD domain-containing putative transcriptional regulator [Pseudonocardia humida]|uniref:AfsR/SARP family transcriptional regulator n=1 Tax=Pseudonocardia humida TaxID=2800819 RepID=A0ABT1A7H2_9PSEU|nr:BTAD domain-containing putative transcriptional regulator [Pseudonocardia humida]MCO1658972.1 AfsR/SARP family transcriptional regulator [Pseudonocardia humida]
MHVGLLGTVEVRRGADPLPLPGLRLRGLLARLALDADRPVPSSVLVDDLWGGAAPDGAGNALQALVSRLRRVIGADLVGTEAGGYRLRVPPDAVDAGRFERLTAEAETAGAGPARDLLGQALALWRGPALADLADLPFTATAATRLGERRARAVEGRARLALRLGDPEPELDALTAQLDELPLREQTAVLLARCLHAADRQADALAALDRTAARLADELGVDPGPELAAARLDVLRAPAPAAARPTRPAPSPLQAPAPSVGAVALTSFIGRGTDLDRVHALLAGSRLVTLTGPGGAGKTRLAREAVQSGPVPGPTTRVVVAELAALTTADQLPAALLSAAGRAALVRVQEEGAPDTLDRLLSALGGADAVLVLDNCEHLVDGVARLTATLLESCPRLRVLATSREPLGVPGEVLHPVDALAPDAAVQLFAERGAAVRPGFRLTPDVRAAAAEICRRLDGQPLPIELAAARLRTLNPAEIAARLGDRFRLLTSGARTALPRHQTLRAVVDWSWDLLGEPERAVARRLSVFAGGATARDAEAVCAAPGGLSPDDVFDLLASLVDKSMVVAVTGAGPTRYRMLETIREYAGERLDEAGERTATEATHARLFLERAEAAEPHLRGAEQLGWLARLNDDAEEIDIALRRAVGAGDSATAHRLVAAMAWSWMIRGLSQDTTHWVHAVHAMTGPAPLTARALTAAYSALTHLGDEDAAAVPGLVEEAVRLGERVEPPRHPVLDLVEPGRLLFTEHDDSAALALARETTDPWIRATALTMVGVWAANDGRVGRQRELIREAHALFARVGDRFGLGLTVNELGELEDLAGHHDAAARAYDEAVALATELRNDEDLPQFMGRRALLEARRGNLDAARAGLAGAIELAGPEGPLSGMLGLFLAQVERLAGDLGAARRELDRASGRVRAIGVGAPQRRASFALSWAAVELAAGDLPTAREHLGEAVRCAVEGQDSPVSASVAEVAARLALDEGDPERAATLLGVAAGQRGEPDLGSPEVAALDAAARRALGDTAAERAYEAGRTMPREAGMAYLAAAVAVPEPGLIA